MAKECHGVVPVSPHPTQLWLSLEAAQPYPCTFVQCLLRKPTLLAEQRWCHHLRPCSWKSNLRPALKVQSCAKQPFWPPALGVSPRSVAHAAVIPHTSQQGTLLSFLLP